MASGSLNILLLSHTFLPRIGGREVVVHYLAQALKELGQDVRVLCHTGWLKNRGLDLGYDVRRYGSVFRTELRKPGWRPRLKEKEMQLHVHLDAWLSGCDVIHAHTTYPTGYIAARVRGKLRGNCGLVVTPHGIDIHTIPEIGHGMRLDEKLAPKIDLALESADAITSISEGIEQSILDAGAPAGKIARIPNGVDLRRFASKPDFDIRDDLGVPADAKLIVSVGNYHLRKGHEVIVKAMPAILASESRARAVIVGRGTEALAPLVAELDLVGKVVLPGALPFPMPGQQRSTDKLAALHANCDAYISAGVQQGAEGLSLAVLEAMAAALPIVASDISGNRDIVRDNENGFLVPPADEAMLATNVLKIMHDEALRRRLGEGARATASGYDWLNVGRQYLELYRAVLNA